MAALPAFIKHELIRDSTSNSIKSDARSIADEDRITSAAPERAQSQAQATLADPSPAKSIPDLESIELNTINEPRTEKNATPSRTARHRRVERIHFLTCCGALFLAGWNDGTTGPLLPTMQTFYKVGFTVISLLFIGNTIGFVGGAAANVFLTDKIGFGKTMALGGVLQIIGYAVESPAPPFPVLIIGYLLNGCGIALQDAQANGYVADLQEGAAAKMGLLHAAYGVGALISPLIATQFAQLPHRWSLHYLTSLGIAVINLVTIIWVFKGRKQEDLLELIGQPRKPHESDSESKSKYKEIWGTKNVHLLAFFILMYVGVEVTTGGWIVTYIQRKRGGGPSSGYVSSGFFGGLTFGRVVLLWVNQKVGEYRVIYAYSLLVIALELTIWLIPSLIGNAVSVSIIGTLLGPMYPIAMNHSARILPRWLLTGSIGWIAGFGQAGSAIIPFITGALASKFGIGALQPFMLVNVCVMIAFWALVPSKHTRAD